MSISEIQLVIFGDSFSDGGYRGQGIAGLDRCLCTQRSDGSDVFFLRHYGRLLNALDQQFI